jgi:hypothetical protein
LRPDVPVFEVPPHELSEHNAIVPTAKSHCAPRILTRRSGIHKNSKAITITETGGVGLPGPVAAFVVGNVTVRIVKPLPARLAGEKLQDAPVGCPEQENEIFWENPLEAATEIVVVIACPRLADNVVGLATRAKSGAGKFTIYEAETIGLNESPGAIAKACIVWLEFT